MNHQEPIVVVDDDTDDHYVIKEIVTKMDLNHPLRFFRNGAEALSYLETTTENPFIILCDINMPVMDGLQLRQRINLNRYLKEKSIPFVYLTTAANPGQVKEAYDLTVQGLFIKESTYEQMEKTFRMIFDYWARCRHPNSAS